MHVNNYTTQKLTNSGEFFFFNLEFTSSSFGSVYLI